MRLKPKTIQLGDHEWLVRPLTIAQVQAIEPVLIAPVEGKAGNIASALAILRIALSRDHAEAVDRLDTVEAGASEISTAMALVLQLGGFIPSKADGAPSLGEAEAGQPPAL